MLKIRGAIMKKFLFTLTIITIVVFAFAAPGIYVDKARTKKKGTFMTRIYYNLSIMHISTPMATTDITTNVGLIFASYGITNNLTFGTNISYVDKTFSNPMGEFHSYGIGDLSNFFKIKIKGNKKMFLSLIAGVKWDSEYYFSSVQNPPIGTNTTDIMLKLPYDRKFKKAYMTIIPSYIYSITDDTTKYENTLKLITSFDIQCRHKIAIETGGEIDYFFSVLHDLQYDELAVKVYGGIQYQISKIVHLQMMGMYNYYTPIGGTASYTDKNGLFLRLGMAIRI